MKQPSSGGMQATAGSSADIVRRALEAFDSDEAAFLELLHPKIEWTPFEEGSPSYGIEGAVRIRSAWLDTWAEHELVVEEVRQAGDDVVADVHLRGRGKLSGVEVDVRLYPHCKVSGGKIVYLYEHEDRAEAFRAAGILPTA